MADSDRIATLKRLYSKRALMDQAIELLEKAETIEEIGAAGESAESPVETPPRLTLVSSNSFRRP